MQPETLLAKPTLPDGTLAAVPLRERSRLRLVMITSVLDLLTTDKTKAEAGKFCKMFR